MSQNFKTIKLMAALGVSTVLAACGGAPSEGEMKEALQKQTDQMIKSMGPLAKMSGVDTTEIRSVEKIGCEKDGENAYRCDVKVVVKVQGKEMSETSRGRFVKTSDGWQASR